ncbi:DUF397 domain-containing protein [Nocardiopsis sp. CC223A]|uniref:DUF397 domain-containing protein n=1 Tax=Nocardiopsis sp. CC223A TaxID=3044051 RepID=UPI00278BE249|nr:DUF397 domain-containing protein [Nocardiopsis sp. CC223A]
MSEALQWFKSSYSSAENFACVEIAFAPTWFKSTYSAAETDCVEVNFGASPAALIRDTQHREAAVLTVGSREWSALIPTVCDRPACC